ncbi:MAG: selenide, water dikinase SelD [Schleiferiaceae bacterium]|nr:selenide, water dikinase SelD [Schleiferiaceae bacterium]
MAETAALTSFNPGSGCGCKIAPNALQEVLGASGYDPKESWSDLLVGHDANDDAAVMDLGDGTALIHTTDFFTPIVDDPYTFGQIAAANALSDVYAMGGKPSMALAVLCWPLDKLPAKMAGQVIAGARDSCRKAGIPLAGGHSIEVPQPIFGLSVTGRVAIPQMKKNGGAKPGDRLYLTKSLGVGIVATAMKKGIALPEDALWAEETMAQLNHVGADLAPIQGVHAMTDVTGFGLIGHLHEMMTASDCSATLDYASIPTYSKERLADLYAMGSMPTGTTKNYVTYYGQVSPVSGEQLFLLYDPQTSGGLLIAVDPNSEAEVEACLRAAGSQVHAIGTVAANADYRIIIE